ncbi:MAG: cation-translocating P-type ATPase [Deltaproteobacteria bacterium]|nr:cation-translocating P-type ATPase [Deltaproteobacteria bacterium]
MTSPMPSAESIRGEAGDQRPGDSRLNSYVDIGAAALTRELPEIEPAPDLRSDIGPFKGLSPVFPAQTELSQIKLELALTTFLLANFFILRIIAALPSFNGIGTDLIAVFDPLMALLAIPVAVYLAAGMARRVIAGLNYRCLSSEIGPLLAVALMSAMLTHLLLFDRAQLRGLGWDQNLIIVLFVYSLARYFQAHLFDPLRRKLLFDLGSLAPYARRYENVSAGAQPPTAVKVKSSMLRLDELIEVSAGEVVPVDAQVVSGRAQVAEIKFSGLPELRHKIPGDQIFAASKIVNGQLVAKVTALQSDAHITTFSAILNKRLSSAVDDNMERHNFYITLAVFTVLLFAVSAAFVWAASESSFVSITSVFSAIALCTIAAQMLGLNAYLRPLAESSAFRAGALATRNHLIDLLTPIKTLVFDYRPGAPQWQGEVSRLEIIDRRVDELSLLSAVFALTGRASSALFLAINHHLAQKHPQLKLLNVKDAHEYPGQGMYGVIEGCDFTLGYEGFLLQRGVLMQQSEVSGVRQEDVLYLALNEEVIARVFMAPPLSAAASRFVSGLKADGVRTILCSMEPGEELDSLGKRIGLELADVYGGLQRETYIRKLDALPSAAFFMNESSDSDVAAKADVTISIFDDFMWDLQRSEVLLFSKSPASLATAVSLAKSHKQVTSQNRLFGFGLAGLVIGLAALGFITPAVSVMAGLTGSIALLLNAYRLAGMGNLPQ